MEREKGLKRTEKAALTVLLSALIFTLCACSVPGRHALIKYAKKNYGDCTFISEEHKGSGNDEVRKVYLEDKDTGIKYTVTSGMDDINIDGSSFGYVNSTGSDFEEKYRGYLLSEAGDEIRDLEMENNCVIKCEKDYVKVSFYKRVEAAKAYSVAEECDKILAGYDVKDMRPSEYVLYAEVTTYLGSYNTGNGSGQTSNSYTVIDYVHTHYDQSAVFKDSIGAYIDQFLPYDEVNRLFPDRDGMPSGTAYYFKDKNGDTVVAICMKDFGLNSDEIRLFRDTVYGMEEIR